MKKIIQKLLASFSRAIIKKYKVKIIGITGSVGKTSTKEMLALVLSEKFRLASTIGNYNNEFGLPLSIIGKKSPKKNIFAWLNVFFRALRLVLFKDKNYPELLILEMGIDREGDMDYLLSIVSPDISILTNISHSHIEYLGSLEKIKKEKVKLLQGVKKDGVAIFNFDNKYLKDLKNDLKSKSFSYGLEEGADFLAKDINLKFPENFSGREDFGLSFKLEQGGSILPIFLPRAISPSQVYSALVSLLTASILGINPIEASNAFKKLKGFPGRMNVLSGIKNSIIIDDTYNASPESAFNALKSLAKINLAPGARKILVFGDMLELGHYSEEGHRLVGEKAVSSGIDLIFTVGERARDIGRGAIAAGFIKDNVFSFAKKEELLSLLKDRVATGDLLLFKGSRGAHMEELLKEFISEVDLTNDLLVN